MENSSSYRKTIALSVAAFFASIFFAALVRQLAPTLLGTLAAAAILFVAAFAAIVVLCGILVLHRHARWAGSLPDLYLDLARKRNEGAIALTSGWGPRSLRRVLARFTLGHDYLVGDDVEVRTLDEIHQTLGTDGSLNGLPFQPEMIRYCGQRFRIFRCVDKIYDYGRTKKMRRLDNGVLLTGLRCDGSSHGGCQAMCYLIWNTQWIKRIGTGSPPPPASIQDFHRIAATSTEIVDSGARTRKYMCQYTQLHGASTPQRGLGFTPVLRPLVAGNITWQMFLTGWGTRLFNWVQTMRGGIGFPNLAVPHGKSEPLPISRLEVGAKVQVASFKVIARTLNSAHRNKGLYFDRDMVKYCGTEQQVVMRVERIIDDRTGMMLAMKTPCILLKDVDYSGEFLNFSAQHDYLFWRESWLSPI